MDASYNECETRSCDKVMVAVTLETLEHAGHLQILSTSVNGGDCRPVAMSPNSLLLFRKPTNVHADRFPAPPCHTMSRHIMMSFHQDDNYVRVHDTDFTTPSDTMLVLKYPIKLYLAEIN